MNNIQNIQTLLPSVIADCIGSWSVIFVNFEFNIGNDSLVSDYIAEKIYKPFFGGASAEQIFFSGDTEAQLRNTSKILCENCNAKFITLDLLIWRKGEYKAFFDFEKPPRRLSGDLAFAGQHLKYLDLEPLLRALL